MAGNTRAYNSFNYGLLRGRFNATTDTYKAALVTASYLPAPIGADRQPSFVYQLNDVVYVVAWGMYFTCVQAGTTSSGTPTWTNVHGALVSDGGVIWRCDTVSPVSTHTAWADVSAYEVSDGTYPAGGVALTGVSISTVDGYAVFTANDIDILVNNVTAKYVVIYKDATVDSVIKPLLMYLPVSADGSAVTVTGGYYRIRPGTFGYLRMSA